MGTSVSPWCKAPEGGHLRLVHAAQTADHTDPWLHAEWAALLSALGRAVQVGISRPGLKARMVSALEAGI